jgi:osmotically inducible lipoprotein OsmB
MRKIFVIVALAALTALSACAERTVTGAAIGAGAGAVVAGPPGAVVGGVAGGVIGGPRISGRHHRACWHDRHGYRHCHWR